MRWFYRLQSRVHLTLPEGATLLVLAAGLAAGFVARYAVAHAAPPPEAIYAAADAAYARADSLAAPATPEAPSITEALGLPADTLAGEPADSAAAQVAEVAVASSARRSARGRKPPPAPTNINTASEQELQRLPRVGPAIAARIVAYRQEVGPFRRPEDIQEVRGIGPKTFEKMAPWIRL